MWIRYNKITVIFIPEKIRFAFFMWTIFFFSFCWVTYQKKNEVTVNILCLLVWLWKYKTTEQKENSNEMRYATKWASVFRDNFFFSFFFSFSPCMLYMLVFVLTHSLACSFCLYLICSFVVESVKWYIENEIENEVRQWYAVVLCDVSPCNSNQLKKV